jgi:hypothetical protein
MSSNTMPSEAAHEARSPRDADCGPSPSRISVNRDNAAKYLREKFGIRTSRQTLAKKAVTGDGPAYRKAGRTPIYDLPELDRYARALIGPLQRSTSETGECTDVGRVDRPGAPRPRRRR